MIIWFAVKTLFEQKLRIEDLVHFWTYLGTVTVFVLLCWMISKSNGYGLVQYGKFFIQFFRQDRFART